MQPRSEMAGSSLTRSDRGGAFEVGDSPMTQLTVSQGSTDLATYYMSASNACVQVAQTLMVREGFVLQSDALNAARKLRDAQVFLTKARHALGDTEGRPALPSPPTV